VSRHTELITLWRNITAAGGISAYIHAQLTEKGYLVDRGDTDGMSDRELNDYKKRLKEEAEERRKLQREAWRAYKSTHIVHLGETIFWSDNKTSDQWDLKNAEERAAENGLPPLDSPDQLAEAMGITVADLRFFTYHREAAKLLSYRRFTIPKRDGGERPIWAPLPELKKAQQWILFNIVERLPMHGAAHGFIPGRSTLTNALHHVDSKLIVKMDIKDFFPTVTWRRAKGIFRHAGYRDQVSTLMALLCTEAPRDIVEHQGKKYFVAMGPRCLPQGAPTSPGITNVLCLRLDQRLTGLAAKLGVRYTRYADDMTFSVPMNQKGDPKIASLIGNVHRIVSEEGFKIHPDKTRFHRPGGSQRVTGLVVNGKAPPRVPRELRRKLRSAIFNAKQGKPRPEGYTPEQMSGMAAYVYMTNPELGAKLMEEIASATMGVV
jgi:RNA-directed DNA polymerase